MDEFVERQRLWLSLEMLAKEKESLRKSVAALEVWQKSSESKLEETVTALVESKVQDTVADLDFRVTQAVDAVARITLDLMKLKDMEMQSRLATRVDHSSSSRPEHPVVFASPMDEEKATCRNISNLWDKFSPGDAQGQDSDKDLWDEKHLSEDSFSFMITAPNWSPALFLGYGILLLQMFTYSLLAASLIEFSDKHNPLGIPVNVAAALRVTQLVAIVISVATQDDVITGLLLLRDGYSSTKGGLSDSFEHTTMWKWAISVALRLLEGTAGLVLSFILIVNSETVIDLLLNFTAMEFVSQFDEVAFYLSINGFFGRQCKSQAIFLGEVTYTINSKRSFFGGRIILMGAFLVGLLCGWGFVLKKQTSGQLLCSTIMVQFGDDLNPKIGTFSGLYTRTTVESRAFSPKRVSYVEQRSGRAQFAFCEDISAWTFNWGTPNDEYDQCNKWRARSETTTTYDLTQTASLKWYVQDAYNREVVLEPFHLSCYDCEHDPEECTGHGSCSDAVCTCNDSRFGLRCEFILPCPSLSIDVRFGAFPAIREQSRNFDLLEFGGYPVTVYSHAVFVNEVDSGQFDVILFTGRRWALTYTGYMTEYNGTNRIALSEYLQDDFHAHFSNYSLAFLSAPMDLATPSDANSPVGFQWFSAGGFTSGIQAVNEAEAVETVLLCSFCDNKTNPCLHNGVCSNGTCACSIGSFGTTCEDPPIGNGYCDLYFNTPEYELDSGDCCDSTCISTEQFRCGLDGYFNCQLEDHEWQLNGEGTNAAAFSLALSGSGRVGAICEDITFMVRLFDKDGAQWKPRSYFLDPQVKTENREIEDIRMFIYEPYGPTVHTFPFIPTEVQLAFTVQFFNHTSQRYEGYAVIYKCGTTKCEAFYEVALADRMYYYGTDYLNFFDMSHGGASAAVVVTEESGDPIRACFSTLDAMDDKCTIVRLEGVDISDVRISNDGQTLGVLLRNGMIVFSWNGNGYTQLGRNLKWNIDEVLDFALAGDGNAFAFIAPRQDIDGRNGDGSCWSYVYVFTWEDGDWARREGPSIDGFGQCGSLSGSSVQLSKDGAILALAGNASESSTPAVFRWNDFAWEPLGQPLRGGVDNLIALSGDGSVILIASPKASDMQVFSRPKNRRCEAGSSLFHLSLKNYLDPHTFFLVNEGTKELIFFRQTSLYPNYATVELDECLNATDKHCYSFTVKRSEGEYEYALFLDGLQLPTGSIRDGDLQPDLIGNCTGVLPISHKLSLAQLIPDHVAGDAALNTLTDLDLPELSLTGTIPSELGLLTKLTRLDLWGNELTGTIPAELSLLTTLAFLDVAENSLTGTLPTELGLLTRLDAIYLEGNSLTGTLPSQLGLLTKLLQLWFSDNSFSGRIPSELGLLTDLYDLYLRNNALLGPLPSEMGQLSSTKELELQGNNMGGSTIPEEFWNMSNMVALDISGNSFVGTISTNIGRMTDMGSFVADHNSIEGTVPSEIGLLVDLRALAIDSNEGIEGKVPNEVCLLRMLHNFTADCGGFVPRIACNCCTKCCDEFGECQQV